MTNTKKLYLDRDTEVYNSKTGNYEDAFGSEAENTKRAQDFLVEAIEEAGFEVKKRSKNYGESAQVFIKDFGGKFYLEVMPYSDHSEYAPYGVAPKDKVLVKEFHIGCTDYKCNDSINDIVYTTYAQITKNLARDLNKFAGDYRALSKGEAKKLKAS